MARPTGAALGGAVYASIYDTEGAEHFKEYVYNVYYMPEAPAFWDSNGRVEAYKHKTDVNIAVLADDEVEIRYDFGINPADPFLTRADDVYGWEGGEDQTARTDTHALSSFPCNSSAEKPKFVIAETTFTDNDDDDSPSGFIHALYFEAQHDESDTSRDIDHIDRSNNSANLYAADMPVSAWHIKHALIGYLNRITRETKPVLTVPCNGIDVE